MDLSALPGGRVPVRSTALRDRPRGLQGPPLRLVLPGQPRRPPVDVRPLPPACWHPLRRDPGVEPPAPIVDHDHEAALAVRQHLLGFGQPAARLEEALAPADESTAASPGQTLSSWCVVVRCLQAELERLVP